MTSNWRCRAARPREIMTNNQIQGIILWYWNLKNSASAPRRPTGQRGVFCQPKAYILLVLIFLILLISSLGISYLTLVNNRLEIAQTNYKSAQSLYYAESGVAAALTALKQEADWSQAAALLVPETSFAGGSYKVETLQKANDTVTIKSTGQRADFQRIIEVTLNKVLVPGKIVQQNWKEI